MYLIIKKNKKVIYEVIFSYDIIYSKALGQY